MATFFAYILTMMKLLRDYATGVVTIPFYLVSVLLTAYGFS